MDTSSLALAAFIVTAISWLSREIWRWRKAKRLATEDAANTLVKKKELLEEMISKTQNANSKQTVLSQLEETKAALLGLYAQRLRQTLKDAGLPTEEELIANGRRRLETQQFIHLKEVTAEVKSLLPFVSAQVLLLLGNAYYHMEQYQDAVNIHDKILSFSPNNPVVLNNRGVVYRKLERHEEALTDFNLSLELRPDDPVTLMNRGGAYVEVEKYQEALADLNRSLDLNPDAPDTLCNRGVTYRCLGRYDEALADYNRALEINPNDPVALDNKGVLYDELGRYDEALVDYNRSLQLRPDYPDALSNRAVTYKNLGRYGEALVDLSRALEHRPSHPGALYNLACLCSLRSKADEALSHLKKAIDKNKKYREMAKTDKDLNNIRDDPRFKKLMESD